MDRQQGTVQWFDPEKGYGFGTESARSPGSLEARREQEREEAEPDDLTPEERGAQDAGEEIEPLDERFSR